MAKVKQNVIIQGLSGSIGGQLVIKVDKGGRTIVSAAPTFDENHEFTEAQKAQHEAFREAAAYAKTAKVNEVYKSKAEGTPQNAYNVAMADWFHEPQILEIDMSAWHGQAGDAIRMRAVDDIQVTQVSVIIADADNETLEQGQAVQEEGFWWKYTMTSATPNAQFVIAIARDLPGHTGQIKWEDGKGVVG